MFSEELESLALKDKVIESGRNVLNNNVEFRVPYSQAAQIPFNLMFFDLYNCFLVIDPDMGITTLEL